MFIFSCRSYLCPHTPVFSFFDLWATTALFPFLTRAPCPVATSAFPCLHHTAKYLALEKCYEYTFEGQNHRSFCRRLSVPEPQINDIWRAEEGENRMWSTQQSWARLYPRAQAEETGQKSETIKGPFKWGRQQEVMWPWRGKMYWMIMEDVGDERGKTETGRRKQDESKGKCVECSGEGVVINVLTIQILAAKTPVQAGLCYPRWLSRWAWGCSVVWSAWVDRTQTRTNPMKTTRPRKVQSWVDKPRHISSH